MKKTAPRFLSLLLVLALCLSLGLAALADSDEVDSEDAGSAAAEPENTESENTEPENSKPEDGESEDSETPQPVDFNVQISGQTSLDVGGETTLYATIDLQLPTDASISYSWSSNAGAVAEVDGDGNAATVTAVSAGSAVITCTVAAGDVSRSATATINVREVEHWLRLTADGGPYSTDATVAVDVNSDMDISPDSLEWSASPSGYLQSKGNGTFTVLKQGASETEVLITGRFGAGGTVFSDSVSIRIAAVTVDPVSLSGGGNLSMELNATRDISASVSGGSGNYLYEWECSGGVSLTSYSASSGSATVRAESVPGGTVTLTVYDQGGGGSAKVTWNITVNSDAKITGVTMSPNSVTMDTYSSRYLTLTVTPGSASYTVTWSSSDTSIATVSGNGANATVNTSGKAGSATITAAVRDNSTGTTTSATCTIYVNADTAEYNPSLTITYGSDYYGTGISDGIYSQFYNKFGVRLPDNASIRFSSTGTTNYGQIFRANGSAVAANTNYSFSEFRDMSFTPYQAGTFEIPYSITCNGHTLSGRISFYIRGASLSVSLDKATLSLPTYSSQYLNLSVSPGNAYYTVSWGSSNNNIATVTGNSTRATVTTRGTAGTVTVSCTVTDSAGVQVVRKCTVTVTNAGATYSPSKVVTIGARVTGTTLADALANQFKTVYGTTLNNNSATISFSSLGDSKVAIRRLANGTPMTANTSYTFQQYIDCYTDPAAVGTLTTPYTLTYNGKTLTGNLIVEVHAAQVSAGITLPDGAGAYSFSTPLASGGNGAGQITTGLNAALAAASSASWSYIRFTASSGQAGTLYANSSRAALTASTNVTADGVQSLFFVPGQSGTFTSLYTAYNTNGGVVAQGTLTITVPGGTVPSGELRVQVSSQKLSVNGKEQNTQIYNINDENYFRLRDIAYMLSGTGSQFAVGFNDASRTISITTGQDYAPLGTEMATGKDYSSTCVASTMPVLINGASVSLTAYNINDNTFYRLRDLGDKLNFSVGYDEGTRTVTVTSR